MEENKVKEIRNGLKALIEDKKAYIWKMSFCGQEVKVYDSAYFGVSPINDEIVMIVPPSKHVLLMQDRDFINKIVETNLVYTRYACKQCKHEWIPRLSANPKICPKCKTRRWNKV